MERAFPRILIRLAMVLAGLALLFILPRDPWPPGIFAALAACAVAGSLLGQRLVRNAPVAAFFLSWALTTVVFTSGAFLLDVVVRGRSMVSTYRQWWFLVAFSGGLFGLAGTLCAFPAVELARKLLWERG